MESKNDRDRRLRKHMAWGGPEHIGITPREAAKLLHEGEGGEAKQTPPITAADQRRINNQIDQDILAAGRRGRR